MKETYRSKISLALVLPVGAIITGILVLMFIQGAGPGILIIICVLAFTVHMFATTYYTIDGDKLIVKCGFMVNISIDIAKITKIVPTSSILSAPATSFDRIEVFYNKYDSVVISPGDKERFIARLREINEGIIYGDKVA